MNKLDQLYKFIGQNDLGITGLDLRWKLKYDDIDIEIEQCKDPRHKYIIQVTDRKNQKTMYMHDDVIMVYSFDEEIMLKLKTVVVNFVKDIENKFPNYLHLYVGDKEIWINEHGIASEVSYNIVSKLEKFVRSMEPINNRLH